MATVAVLSLAGFVPGLMLVDWCIGTSRGLPWYEKGLYAVGAGYSLIVSGMLLLSYISGPIERWHVIVLYGFVNLILLAAWMRRRHIASQTDGCPPHAVGMGALTFSSFRMPALRRGNGYARLPRLEHGRRGYFAAIFVVLALTLFFRFTNLSYSEFQGDEAIVALAATDAIQGYDGALFHRLKGPAEVLLPAYIYRVTGTLTEYQARLPFAIANTLAVLAVLLLGSRLIGPLGGWIAAVLLALDGYLIAFGRIVQYQSLVFLMVVLTVLVLYRLARSPTDLGVHHASSVAGPPWARATLTGPLFLAALYSATGVLAHYEALFVAIPGGYLLWQVGRRVGFGKLLRAAIIPLLLGCALFALFYLPFALRPTFGNTFWYLFGYRMGGTSEVDSLQDFFFRTTLYSTSYYLFLLIALTVVELARLYWRVLPKPIRLPSVALLFVCAAVLLAYPDWLASTNPRILGAVLALILAVAWMSPGVPRQERLIWLWYGVTLVVAVFLTSRPNSHVYSIFIPWALLVGLAGQHIWSTLTVRFSAGQIFPVTAGMTAVLIFLFSTYGYWLFIHNHVEVLRTWPENRPPGFWVAYDEPVEVAIFGFPLRNGWKTVAALYQEGILDGGFDTNARPTVADWYTRGRGPCARDDPRYYLLSYPVEPTLADERRQLRSRLEEKYQLFATIEVHGEPHLEVFQRADRETGAQHHEPMQPQVLDDAAYSALFDGNNVETDFPRNGPVGPVEFQYPADHRFDNGMWLRGFELGQPTIAAGDDLDITLYWQATDVIRDDYYVSVQIIDMDDFRKAGQRDGEPGCNQYPTSIWIPGDLISDRYRVTIADDAVAGDYTLLVTVYSDAGSVDLIDAAGNAIGTSIPLAEVRILN